MPSRGLRRWVGFLTRKPPTIVLGGEIAAAKAAEEAHRAQTDEPSPMAGISYEKEETDLFRFRQSETDRVLSAFLDEWRPLTPHELDRVRSSLTMTDFYTLLTFARRSAVSTLRSRSSRYAIQGFEAIAVIDSRRIDWRDGSWAAALDSFAIDAVDKEAPDALEAIAARGDEAISGILRLRRREPVTSLGDWGFRLVDTEDGPALVGDHSEPYSPSRDLLEVALDVTAVLERDVWRVRDFTTGASLPPVWLAQGDAELLAAATKRVRGCVSLHADLETSDFDRPETQQLLVFVAQAATEDDARVIARAAGPGPTKSFVALGANDGDLCAVLVFSSWYRDGETFEESLDRFREGVAEALARRAG